MTNARIMRIRTVAPGNVARRSNLAKVIATITDTIAMPMSIRTVTVSISVVLSGTAGTAGAGQEIGQGDPGGILETGKTIAIAVQNTADVIQIGAGGAKRRVEATGGRKQIIIVVQIEIGTVASILSRASVRGRSRARIEIRCASPEKGRILII